MTITLVEGSNELNVGLVPVAPPEVLWEFGTPTCYIEPSGVGVWFQVIFSSIIKNIGEHSATKVVRLRWRRVDLGGGWMLFKEELVNLAPGETYNFESGPGIYIYYGYTYELFAEDEDGYSSEICTVSM